MTTEEKAQLRQLLGEVVPVGGSDSDTMFTDDDVVALYEQNGSSLQRAALAGWRIKAARYADMVNVSESGESMELGQLHGAALKMVAYYEELVSSGDVLGTTGTRIHRLTR